MKKKKKKFKPFHLNCLYLIMSCKDFSYDKKVTRYGWVLLLPSQNLYINIYSTTESCFNAYFIYNLFVYAYSIIILQNTCFFFFIILLHIFFIFILLVSNSSYYEGQNTSNPTSLTCHAHVPHEFFPP